MWVLAVLVAVSVLVAFAARRHGADARDSVDVQRQRLDALRTAVTAADPSTGRTAEPATRSFRPRRRRSWRPPAAPRPAVLVTTALVLVVAVGLVLALVLPDDSKGGNPAQRATARARSKAAASTSTSSTTSTTLPRAAVVGTQGGGVTVSVPAATYTVTLTARGSCWMRAERPDNTVVDTTTLRAGDSRDIPGSGPLTVRLGNPAVVDVAVDGQPLALPPPHGPVDLHLAPPGSPT
jgi:hypothetical protein